MTRPQRGLLVICNLFAFCPGHLFVALTSASDAKRHCLVLFLTIPIAHSGDSFFLNTHNLAIAHLASFEEARLAMRRAGRQVPVTPPLALDSGPGVRHLHCTDTTTPRSQPTTTSTYDATTTTHDHAYARGNMKRFQNAQRKDPLAFYILHKRYITSPLSHHTVAEHRLTTKPRGKQGRKTQKDRIQRQATKRNLRSFHGFLPCATDTQGTDKFHRKQTKDTTVFKMYGGVRSAARQLAEPDEAQTCEPAR